jgi:flagellar biosynthesis protein FlhG
VNGTADQANVLRETNTAPARAPWVAVAGGKGGVGKTLIAVNLAVLMAKAGRRVLLVDLDPGLGNVDVHLRLAPRFTVEDAATGACEPRDAVVPGPAGIGVLAGRSGSPKLASGDAGFLARVLAAVQTAATGYDIVVCDTGAGIGPAVLAVCERADLVLAVTAPDPAAVTDTYALCKLVSARGRPMPRLVVNRVRSRDEAMRTAGKLATVCRKFLQTDCSLLGWLQSDVLLERSVAEQRPLALSGQGAAIEDLHALCAGTLSALAPMQRRMGMSARVPRLRMSAS